MHNLKMNVEIPEEILGAVLVTAFDGNYGGCNYWAETELTATKKVNGETMWLQLKLEESESKTVGESVPYVLVDFNTVQLGMQRILDDPAGPLRWKDWIGDAIFNADAGVIDASLANAIIQYALYGDMVY